MSIHSDLLLSVFNALAGLVTVTVMARKLVSEFRKLLAETKKLSKDLHASRKRRKPTAKRKKQIQCIQKIEWNAREDQTTHIAVHGP